MASLFWVAIEPNPKEVLAVAPDSATKLVPSPTIILPSVTSKPAKSDNCASKDWTSVQLSAPLPSVDKV